MKSGYLIAATSVVLAALGAWYFYAQKTPDVPSATPDSRTVPVTLYYYDPARDQGPGGAQCGAAGLAGVERRLPESETLLADTIRLLLRGEISDEERARGIATEFPLAGVELVSASTVDGVATLAFSDPQNKTGGGSCRVSMLWAQIEATAKQFPGVTSVRFAPDDLFQP